jgi:hypothetical protein
MCKRYGCFVFFDSSSVTTARAIAKWRYDLASEQGHCHYAPSADSLVHNGCKRPVDRLAGTTLVLTLSQGGEHPLSKQGEENHYVKVQ